MNRQETLESLRLIEQGRIVSSGDFNAIITSAITLLEADAIPGGFERGENVEVDGRVWQVIGRDGNYVALHAPYNVMACRLPEALTRVPATPSIDKIKAAAIAEIDAITVAGQKRCIEIYREAKRKIEEAKP